MRAKSSAKAKEARDMEPVPKCSKEENSKLNTTSNEKSHWVKGKTGMLQVK